MIGLWIAAALLSAGAAVLIVLRAAEGARDRGTAEPDLAVYRRQMDEIDALAERGLLAEPERRSIRAETGRRLLAAAHRTESALRSAPRGLVVALAAAIPMAAAVAYAFLGAPAYQDMPFKARLAEWRATDPSSLTAPEMAAILREVAAEHPTDPAPLQHLAEAEMASGQASEAIQALHRALAVAPTRIDLWQALGEAEVAAGNGEVNDAAQDAYRKVLALAPGDPEARYALARARIAAGDTAGGLAEWRARDAALPAGDDRKATLDAQIAEVTRTGVLPSPQAEQGPAEAQGSAAGAPGMPGGAAGVGPAQIQAMVDGLAAQLKANPDDPDGWVRLVRALTVLGETQRRDAALAEARQRYAGHADVLAALDAATRPPS
jgi:cytochrome c-type biogenesis protein CcmH